MGTLDWALAKVARANALQKQYHLTGTQYRELCRGDLHNMEQRAQIMSYHNKRMVTQGQTINDAEVIETTGRIKQ
jgi:hypothetical protein